MPWTWPSNLILEPLCSGENSSSQGGQAHWTGLEKRPLPCIGDVLGSLMLLGSICNVTWRDLSHAQGEAAQWLMDSGRESHLRAVCGRAYYSAYALVTANLPEGMTFGRGWNNPEHAKLPGYVDALGYLDVGQRRRMKMALRRLRQRREDADYRPGITVARPEAKEALRDAEEIRQIFQEQRR